MLQYSYSPISPIPAKKLGVKAEIVRFVLRNVPPATVWRYRPLAGGLKVYPPEPEPIANSRGGRCLPRNSLVVGDH